ncbi:MAG: hypothetical protein K9H64_09500 [Bacteroidales bacterium]|nr:hypothetical protein [Bacteroidales bacterium]MCF8456100.1 hypothetical protein [Bacteroidales bacterium]
MTTEEIELLDDVLTLQVAGDWDNSFSEKDLGGIICGIIGEQKFHEIKYKVPEFLLEIINTREGRIEIVEILTQSRETKYKVNERTEQFLRNGGFKRQHKEAYEEFLEQKERNELQMKKLRIDVKWSEFLLKTKWLPHILSLLAILIALGTLGYNIYANHKSKKDEVSQQENIKFIIPKKMEFHTSDKTN